MFVVICVIMHLCMHSVPNVAVTTHGNSWQFRSSCLDYIAVQSVAIWKQCTTWICPKLGCITAILYRVICHALHIFKFFYSVKISDQLHLVCTQSQRCCHDKATSWGSLQWVKVFINLHMHSRHHIFRIVLLPWNFFIFSSLNTSWLLIVSDDL